MLTALASLSLTFSALGGLPEPHTMNASAGHDTRIPIGMDRLQVVSDTELIADGVTYGSWDELADSGYFSIAGHRCGAAPSGTAAGISLRGTPSDCSFSRTNTEAQYEPDQGVIRIPVVVHVIQRTNGTGFISEERVRSQIDILNEDFLAIDGTNGEDGDNAQIEFFLATEDPGGAATSGITYSTNNTWFNDGGAYYNTLAWDTSRYLNIYTNSASGALGYVPDLPQGGIAGSDADRVVVLYSSFGRNAPLNNFNLGRTATHEVGHYLGLLHTFDGGCSNSSCNTSGDLICDTNPESFPTNGCPSSRTSCGLPAPFDNYMDYAYDACMRRFTPNQINRMRCTIENYRPELNQPFTNGPCNTADNASPFGVLDLDDINGFVESFATQDASADLSAPEGIFDLADIQAFVVNFSNGCP